MSVRITALALLAFALPLTAQANKGNDKVHTVRFSYEKWSRTGQAQYVLVPKPATTPKGTLQERTRQLFKAVLGAKRNTYGDARLAFKPDAAQTGIVYVYLDAKKAQYNAITMAETTYTFTENGASRVIFPNVQAQGWTRDDVPFPAYVLSVPLWQALPPATLSGALVQLPDGTQMAVERALEGLGKGDEALTKAVWSYLDKGSDAAALAAVKGATALKFAGLEDRLIALLGEKREAIRSAALQGLDGHDTPKVNQALRTVMDKDASAGLRDQAAVQLAKSKDPKFAVAAQYHALRSKDPKVVAKAAAALGASKEAEAGEKLLGLLGHADAGVRRAAIESLLQRGDRAPLVKRLSGDLAAENMLEIARALAKTDDKAAVHPALIHLATKGKGDDSAQAAERLAGFDKKPTYAALGIAAKHPEAATRRAAALSLRTLNKPAALPFLAAADVDDAETGSDMLATIRAIYGSQSLDFVLKATKGKNKVLGRAAVATLGEMVAAGQGKKNRKTIVKALDALSKADDALVRAAAARSYGLMPGEDVAANVKTLTGDKAVEVQRAIAHSLRAYPGQETNTILLGFAGQKDAELKANALESLGVLKADKALDTVVTHLGHDDARVRRAATGALVGIGGTLDAAKRKPMLSFFSERVFDKDADVRLKAVEGLKLVNDPRTVTALAALLQDPVIEVRKATLLAMAATGDGGAAEPISTGLEDDDLTVRKTAIEALGALARKEGRPLLEAYAAKEQNKDLAALAKKTAAGIK